MQRLLCRFLNLFVNKWYVECYVLASGDPLDEAQDRLRLAHRTRFQAEQQALSFNNHPANRGRLGYRVKHL